MSAEPDRDTGWLTGLPPGMIDDKELALAFKAGEKGAYQAIHDRYNARVYGVCRRMLGHPHDAEEAAQETFLRTYQALGRFNGRYQLGAWITRIATNVCLDHLRAKSRRPHQEATLELFEAENLDVAVDDGPEEVVIRNFEGRRVRKILAGLPPMHRAAIVLRDFEGLTYEEVAIALGITDCQVKALIHRARQGFKRSWVSAGLAALVPTRLFHRFRTIESVAKEPVATSALNATAQAAPACTNAFQQCGQYMAEKLAPVLTVALVGAAATGSAPVTASPGIDRQMSRDTSKATSLLGLQPTPRPLKIKETREPEATAVRPEPAAPPVTGPSAPAPQPEPTTQPQPEPSPTSEAPPEGTPSGNEPDNTQPPAPQPLRPSVGFDRGVPIAKTPPKSEQSSVNCSALTVDQRLETNIWDGGASYPALVELHVEATGGWLYLTVWKDGYEIRYPSTFRNTSLKRSGNNIQLSFEGTYGSHHQADAAGLPQSSTLRGDLRLDCAASSVVDEALVFGVSEPEN